MLRKCSSCNDLLEQKTLVKFFPFRLRGRSEAYSLVDIKKHLERNGIKILDYRSTFYIPRSLFWVVYRFMPCRLPKNAWVMVSIAIESFLMRLTLLRDKGYELLITAEISKQQKYSCP